METRNAVAWEVCLEEVEIEKRASYRRHDSSEKVVAFAVGGFPALLNGSSACGRTSGRHQAIRDIGPR